MSNEEETGESQKSASSDECGQSPTISVDIRVQNVGLRRSLASLSESPDTRVNAVGVDRMGSEQASVQVSPGVLQGQATALSSGGRPVSCDSCPPACFNSSVILPSGSNVHFRHAPRFLPQAVVDNNNARYDNATVDSAYALLISGVDDNDAGFTRVCANDVIALRDILPDVIPSNNTYLITPGHIRTERGIEYLYSHIQNNNAKKFFLYFSGHGVSMAANRPRLNCSHEQGNALDISRIKEFIESLLPGCIELTVILDCCSAGGNLLLPMLPANVMPERVHVQWASSKAGGKSYIYAAGQNSVFTSHIISALSGTNVCPNRSDNCPLCLRLMMFVRENGYADFTSMALLEYVHDHLRQNDHKFSFLDLPQCMTNPVATDYLKACT